MISRKEKIGETMLQKNLLSGIVALILIVLLIFSAVKLVQLFLPQDAKNAGKLLEKIIAKVNALNDGEENTFLFAGTKGISDWRLYAWGKDDLGKPDKCYLDSCLCICPPSSNILDTPTNVCQEKGICRKIDKVNTKMAFRENLLNEDGSVWRFCDNLEGVSSIGATIFTLNVRKDKDSLIISSVKDISRNEWKAYEESEAIFYKCKTQ